MESNFKLKPFDKVLVRDSEDNRWQGDIFLFFDKDAEYKYYGIADAYRCCIPYEGNEHLFRTTNPPERLEEKEVDQNTLFGVRLKSGYVLEFADEMVGVLFPLRVIGFPNKEKFAIINTRGMWVELDCIDVNQVVSIRGCSGGKCLTSGDLLWKRPQKQALTKAEIAEKLGMSEQDFEIVENEDPE